MSVRETEVVIVGAGQSGLSMSYCLKQRGISHVVLEKKHAVHTWHNERWDSFCLVTPNWQCALPGYPYMGADPHGFMVKHEILDYLRGFIEHVDAPLQEGVTVERIKADAGGFELRTSKGLFRAQQVVVASGGYQTPIVPRFAERISSSIQQIHSQDYKNPEQVQSGPCWWWAPASRVHRSPRTCIWRVGKSIWQWATRHVARVFIGERDVTDWLDEMGNYDVPIVEHPSGDAVRDNTNHYLTGRDGGRDIDLRRFAREGMTLIGRLEDLDGTTLRFRDNLAKCLDTADATYNRINAAIDVYIEKRGINAEPGFVYQPLWTPEHTPTDIDLANSDITSIVWCIGFLPHFTVELSVGR